MEEIYIEIGNEKHCPPDLKNNQSSVKTATEYQGILASSNKWIELACSLASDSVSTGGGPFGAVILQIDKETENVLRYWTASNKVVEKTDPTAHAEVEVIRKACHCLGVYNLGGISKVESKLDQPGKQSYCVIYSSCEPCPMCHAAISWARIPALYFAADRYDAAKPGADFSDLEFYKELEKPYSKRKLKVCKCFAPNAIEAFEKWKDSGNLAY